MNQCNFKTCSDNAARHLFSNYYCNEHNWYLRKKLQRDQPNNVQKFLEEHM